MNRAVGAAGASGQTPAVTSPVAPHRVALLAPMPQELRPLVERLALRPERRGAGALLSGSFGPIELVASLTGIGTEAAARATERILDTGPIEHLLVVGIAGGIGPSVRIGDVVVPELVLDLATGVEYPPTPLGAAPARGVLATSDELLERPEDALRLARRGVIAIDMETAAIAAVCTRRRCPWSVFRAVSDRADDGTTDAAVFGLVGPDGTPDLLAVLRFVLRRPWRIPQLVALGRGARLATGAAAAAALRALESLDA
jgi:adenosylhomocysteine nucleosidase